MKIADVDARVEVRLADGELEPSEIELHRSDPELVRRCPGHSAVVTTYERSPTP